ncbi:heavy metal translocating P-type ATPase [Nitratireductor aquimarinus]
MWWCCTPVPSDGVVVTGRGGIDEANITGESMPVSKEAGAPVFEATINLDGVLEVSISRPVSDSTIARMIRLVTEAQAARAPSERFSEWFGQRYTVAVLAGGVLAFAAFWWLGSGWELALYRAATLLVAASPCAIVISVPAAILSALSAAARGGVLFKGGGALETLASVDTFAFDKTGTLTTGRASVTRLVALDGDQAGFLSLLSGLEAHSEHHIAAAIHREAISRDLQPVAVTDVNARPGIGIEGRDASGPVWAGNPYLAQAMGAALDHPALQVLADGTDTVVYLGRGAQVLGAVTVADAPRGSSAPALAALRKGGVRRMVMMTGDRRPVALRICAELGLVPDEIHAGNLPEDKGSCGRRADQQRQGRLCRRRGERRGGAGPRRYRHCHGRGGVRGGASGRRCGAAVRGYGAAGRCAAPVAPNLKGDPAEPDLSAALHNHHRPAACLGLA